MLKIHMNYLKLGVIIMLLFIVEIIIMIVAIMLGLRTAGALGCGIFAIVAQLIMIFGFQLPPGSALLQQYLLFGNWYSWRNATSYRRN